MDGYRFDTLVISLTTTGSRRRALGGLLAGALGVLGWQGQEDAAAHEFAKKCKKKSGEAKKKCLKKAKKHKAAHANETAEPPGPVGPVATCSDNVKNGSESDVDCGGPNCPRCADDRTCVNRNDCASARCFSGKCQSCNNTDQCGTDIEGSPCSCAISEGANTSMACVKTTTAPVEVSTCTQCLNDWACVPNLSNGGLRCIKLCGAP